MADETDRLHQTWVSSDRMVPSTFVQPLMRFTHVEAAGGVVLLLAAVLALLWANGPFGDTYETFWNTHITIEIGSFHFDESLQHIVNDGLMAIFFFVVGLEIKRELVVGELNDPRRAALPAIAALGGMIAPAVIYLAFTASTGGDATSGWGIPMATDIAFSVGVISLLGSRVSVSAKLFLLALAIADDIGAIAVIAIFYTDELNLLYLAIGIGGVIGGYIAQRVAVRSMLFYTVLALGIWYFVLESGVHATLAGVALGLITPVRAYYSDADFRQRSHWIMSRFDMASASPQARERIDSDALELAAVARESVSPLDRLEKTLHPWSSFVIVPIFAVANAGVRLVDIDVGAAVTSAVALGVTFGLVAGKIIGIMLFTFLAIQLGFGSLPNRTSWRQIVGLAGLAGIGFTVSLFITELAFTTDEFTDDAKIGIFLGSAIAGLIGYFILRSSPTPAEQIATSRSEMGLDSIEYDDDAATETG